MVFVCVLTYKGDLIKSNDSSSLIEEHSLGENLSNREERICALQATYQTKLPATRLIVMLNGVKHVDYARLAFPT